MFGLLALLFGGAGLVTNLAMSGKDPWFARKFLPVAMYGLAVAMLMAWITG